ncbi:MAG: quinone oxidoreductase family protein [Pseudolabrys sp.]
MQAAGGPDVLAVRDIDLSPPAAGEVRIRHTAVGVNFVDIYQRQGLYPVPGLPAVLGVEGAGIVEGVGPDVSDVAIGARVAYAGLPIGGYAQARNIPHWRIKAIPDGIDDRTATAAMLRGVTAHMLLTEVYPVTRGTTVLVHAAAGGLGLILTQWAKRLGATVFGTVGSPAKAELARAAGLDHAILYRETDFAAAVRDLTGGRGADVAYDGIGGDTLVRTLDSVRFFGLVVSLGQAAGALPQLPLTELGPRRSIALARPSVFAYANDRVRYAEATAALFAQIESGLKISVGAEFELAQAAQAHLRLERGETTGSVLLRP